MITLMTASSIFLHLTQFIMMPLRDHPAFRGFAMLTLHGDGRGGIPVGWYFAILCLYRMLVRSTKLQ